MARRRRRHNFPQPLGSTTARGYGARHQAERKRWEPVVESGYASCCRCGFPIAPGTPFHLDHRDDKLGYLGVSHALCNMRAAARRGNEIRREREKVAWLLNLPERSQSREW